MKKKIVTSLTCVYPEIVADSDGGASVLFGRKEANRRRRHGRQAQRHQVRVGAQSP